MPFAPVDSIDALVAREINPQPTHNSADLASYLKQLVDAEGLNGEALLSSPLQNGVDPLTRITPANHTIAEYVRVSDEAIVLTVSLYM